MPYRQCGCVGPASASPNAAKLQRFRDGIPNVTEPLHRDGEHGSPSVPRQGASIFGAGSLAGRYRPKTMGTNALGPVDQLFLLMERRQQPMHVAGLQLFSLPPEADDEFVRQVVEQVRLSAPAARRVPQAHGYPAGTALLGGRRRSGPGTPCAPFGAATSRPHPRTSRVRLGRALESASSRAAALGVPPDRGAQ